MTGLGLGPQTRGESWCPSQSKGRHGGAAERCAARVAAEQLVPAGAT